MFHIEAVFNELSDGRIGFGVVIEGGDQNVVASHLFLLLTH
ncbi:hypothetical protein BSU04_13995 [Caballeronia sordidicola]|uniref:Uncharacterized protein n=1 Tax=Caballeronia sordidicola TaxID=196367 RepID=A0A226X3N0_CABSO|nr:hypothetical protein BSU04_13995 [Caballeronia sordidicola]